MMKRIHIVGASGSGTTTLGGALADARGCQHFDTDDYFWIRSNPPFRTIRDCAERQALLRAAIDSEDEWTLSGSLCGWGDFAIPSFDLVVFLRIPHELRMRRLRQREIERNGPEIEDPGDPRHEMHKGFLEWAAAYDSGGLDIRSKASHEAWLSALPGRVLRLASEASIEENLATVLRTAEE